MKRPAFLWLLPLILLTVACGNPSASPPLTHVPVNVLYAGSLVHLMEGQIGPSFQKATGDPYLGEGGGSTDLAQLIASGSKSADIFISASPSAVALLMGKGGPVKWYVLFARSSLVLAFNPKGPHAALFQAAKAGETAWYQPLLTPGVRLGRTDPLLDPKGVSTLFLFQLAVLDTHHPGLDKDILGPAENPAQVFPETSLVASLLSGQIDAAVLYRSEAVQEGVPFITLPTDVNLSDPSLDTQYARASYTSPQGKVSRGSAIVFALTVLQNAKNPSGGALFARYLLSGPGQKDLLKAGLFPVKISLVGSASAVPTLLKGLIGP